MPINAIIEQYLTDTTNVLENAKAPEIQAHIAPYGLDVKHIAAIEALLNEAKTGYGEYLDEHYEAEAATESHVAAFEQLRARYVRERSLLRVAFADVEGAPDRLRLEGSLPEAQEEVLFWAEETYTTLDENPSLQAMAATVNVRHSAVASALASIREVRALYRTRQEEQGEAEASTATRNVLLDRLKGAMHDFNAIVDIVLADDPALRKRLGR